MTDRDTHRHVAANAESSATSPVMPPKAARASSAATSPAASGQLDGGVSGTLLLSAARSRYGEAAS